MSERADFDACVIGHVVLDRNVIAGREQPPQPGGAAYYASVAYARLGLRVAVLTRVAAEDEALLLDEIRALGIQAVNLGAPCSTVFRNIDPLDGAARREQRVDQKAPPILAGQLPALRSRTWHLGPLREDDLDPALADDCRQRRGRVAIDIQGLTRRVEDGLVVPVRSEQHADLSSIDVLKADDAEILTYTGRTEVDGAARAVLARGAREVTITKADRGSILYAGADRIEIPAFHPATEIDPTGCGDTYLATYLARRLETDELEECGRFAAAAAAVKLAAPGALRGDLEEIAAFRSWAERAQT